MNLEAVCAPRSTGSVELAVDLSNICRNPQVDSTGDGARWDRLLRVLQIWNDSHSAFERPVVVLVADDNLRHLLSAEDRRALARAVRDGYAIETPKADPMLLDLAKECGCMILSNDNFVSYRRGRAWMEEEGSRFVQVRNTDGLVHLNIVSLRSRSSFSKSRAEEQDELKDMRIDLKRDFRSELLASVYRCDNLSCIRRAFVPQGAASAPERGRAGEAVCPGCKVPLTRIGDANETAVIKLSGPGAGDPHRIPITRRSGVTIGRASDDLSLADVLQPAQLRRVSREHLRVEFGDQGVRITDLGSSNGSSLSRWDKAHRSRTPAVRLAANTPVDLRPRDLIVLAGVLSIERSGRRFPFDLEPFSPQGGQAPDAPRTVVHTEEEF